MVIYCFLIPEREREREFNAKRAHGYEKYNGSKV